MRLLISGGGTGGHVLPALAIAQAFRAEHPSDPVLFLGRKGGPEEDLVPRAGFDLETLPIRGLDREAPWKNLVLPAILPASVVAAVAILERFRPDVVVGTGAYVMFPAVTAARLLGIPYALVVGESRGLAVRMLARDAAAVCVAFPGTEDGVHARKVVATGFPIRDGFRPRTPTLPPRRLLVMGGSQGARRLNEVVWEGLDQLCQRFEEVIHLTGRQGAGEAGRRSREGYRAYPFAADVPQLMAEADIVFCRAGVGTLAEVTAVGLPLILAPGRFAGAHQEDNARRLEAAGAAVAIWDRELSAGRLLEVLDGLTLEQLSTMAAASRAWGRPEAARHVLAILSEALEVPA